MFANIKKSSIFDYQLTERPEPQPGKHTEKKWRSENDKSNHTFKRTSNRNRSLE